MEFLADRKLSGIHGGLKVGSINIINGELMGDQWKFITQRIESS
jgi:hypothetical protein